MNEQAEQSGQDTAKVVNVPKSACKQPKKRFSTGGGLSHTVRTRDGGKTTLKYTKGMAIKLMCTECMGWETHPRDCTSTLCPLFPYRRRTLASQKGDQQ